MADVSLEGEVQQPASPEDRLTAMFKAELDEKNHPPAQAAEADSGVEDQLEAGDGEQAQPETEHQEEPFEELEHLGKRYEVPASLKKAFEENRARFTQASTKEKALEALQAQVATRAQLLEAESQFGKYAEAELSEKARLEGLLSQYKKLDWYSMSPEDYATNSRNRDIIVEQLEDAKSGLEKKRGEFDGWRSKQREEVQARGYEYLTKVIPNYESEETRTSIVKAALSLGFTKEEIAAMSENGDPRPFVAFHQAAQWARLQASKPQVANKASKAGPVVRPTASTGSNQQAKAQEKVLRARLAKSGDMRDAAALILQKMQRN